MSAAISTAEFSMTRNVPSIMPHNFPFKNSMQGEQDIFLDCQKKKERKKKLLRNNNILYCKYDIPKTDMT